MNFHEWFKKDCLCDENYGASHESWDACKKEVLKIIGKHGGLINQSDIGEALILQDIENL